MASILVHQTIDEFQSKEDERLQVTINSPDFSRTLLHITGRYDKLMPDGDRIMISSDMGDFDMKDLAREPKSKCFCAEWYRWLKIMDNSAFYS